MSDFESWHASIAPSRSSSGHFTISIRSSGIRLVVLDLGEPCRLEDRHLLLGEAGAREEPLPLGPLLRLEAHLLLQLALRALEVRLALDVELSRRHLEKLGVADRLARLAHEPHHAVAVRDDPHRAGMRDDLALRLLAVGSSETCRCARR